MTTKRKTDYVDKEKFYHAMKEFVEKRRVDPDYKMSDYISTCLMEICTRVMFMPSFINYPFRDEMILDAIEICVRYADRFDPDAKSKNPFGYFTTSALRAGLQRIKSEKKQLRAKAALVQSGELVDVNDEELMDPEFVSSYQYLYNFDTSPPQKKKKKKKIYDINEVLVEDEKTV